MFNTATKMRGGSGESVKKVIAVSIRISTPATGRFQLRHCCALGCDAANLTEKLIVSPFNLESYCSSYIEPFPGTVFLVPLQMLKRVRDPPDPGGTSPPPSWSDGEASLLAAPVVMPPPRLYLLCLLVAAWLEDVLPEVLTPPYFNIAEKRKVEASYTCGEDVQEPELYCKLVGATQDYHDLDKKVISGQICDNCDPSNPEKMHPPAYAVDGAETYWISPPLSRGTEYNLINFTISLGQ
ncbi:hypothetical protein GE061_004502, partial [Apolygus lucorum]